MSLSLPKPLSTPKEIDLAGKVNGKVLSLQDLKDLLARLQQEQNKIQELLSFLGYALRSFRNLNQFLELIPIIVSRVTDADGGALILFKGAGQMRLESLHCMEITNGQANRIRQAIEEAIKQVLAGAPHALDDLVSRYLGSEMKLYGASVIVKEAVRGRLYVFSGKSDFIWNETRRRLLRLIADQTAVGIENSELAAELLQKERQDRELEIGAEIQKQLLPATCPTIAGVDLAARCLTASQVGGDFYDFIPTKQGGDRWGIVVADVMGKGVPAGLIMTMTRGMLRSEVWNGHPPQLILEHLNAVMYEDLEKARRFVTMFYAEYDPQQRLLSYSNAAHAPALLWRQATKSVQTLDTLGALIGLQPDSRYEQRSCQLAEGDVLLLYTDGITEAPNHRGDRFGEERLTKALQWACQAQQQAEIILQYILQEVEAYSATAVLDNDDKTLVVMRICNNAIHSSPNP
ncbi:MAG: PP2C family protein-serine/threonine phosphatase [Pseudanabaenaceae cyanobacterium]